jgi:hypothetical protein
VLLNRLGFGRSTADILSAEAERPYAFREIMSIGKGRLDPNVRDKCYMVIALAHHADDVRRLRSFADPKTRYRDVRYGLAVGLGMRGKPDGVDLLVDLATRDPISVVRREARASLRAIQETQRMAGRRGPDVRLPEPLPFEAHYQPRGLTWPGPVVERPAGGQPPKADSLEDLKRMVAQGLAPNQYRDLNNGNNQAPGATRLMVRGIAPFEQAVALLSARYPQQAASVLQDLLNSPYPFAHFLALRQLRDRPQLDAGGQLTARLESFAKAADTVGFFWTCEAIAQRGAEDSIPLLVRCAELEAPDGVHGPAGMGFGYPAAKAAARLAGRLSHPAVKRLLGSENVWLQAGTLAGLTQADAPGLAQLLARLLREPHPAMIRDHAAAGLLRLRPLPARAAEECANR